MLMMVICMFFWGSVFPIAKLLLINMSGLSLAICRFVIAVFSLSLYIQLRRINLPVMIKWQWLIIILTGIVGIGGFNLAFFSGLQHTSSMNGALIMALSPMVTSLLSALFKRHWLDKKQCFSLLIALSGVILVITNGSLAHLIQFNFNQGDLLILVAMFIWSGYTLCSQKLSDWLPAIPYTLISMAAGGVSLLLFSLTQAEPYVWQEVQMLSLTDLVGVIYIGLFATVLGYLFWIKGISQLGSAKASLFFNLVPVFAALISLMFGQMVTQVQLIGMMIVFIGLTVPLWVTSFNKFSLSSYS